MPRAGLGDGGRLDRRPEPKGRHGGWDWQEARHTGATAIGAMNTALKSICIAAALALTLATAAMADNFVDGVAAAARGDVAAALHIFSDAAQNGDAKSQFALAEMYRRGDGVGRNIPEATSWYRKAADQDNPGAEYALGVLYDTGQGVPRNQRTAASWYAKAARHGYASAQVRLGDLYSQGHGVPQSDDAAMSWFEKAAAQGDADGRQRFSDLARKAAGDNHKRFRAMMDRVFGPGRWRETGGYRTLAKENELRREGAGTVPLGQRSRHSMGSPKAPGAYDVVVAGMSPQLAAAKLRRSREELARVVAEVAHGTQGPHLHVEPILTRVRSQIERPTNNDAGGPRTTIQSQQGWLPIATAPAAAGR
jgi:TPR repeat protein